MEQVHNAHSETNYHTILGMMMIASFRDKYDFLNYSELYYFWGTYLGFHLLFSYIRRMDVDIKLMYAKNYLIRLCVYVFRLCSFRESPIDLINTRTVISQPHYDPLLKVKHKDPV